MAKSPKEVYIDALKEKVKEKEEELVAAEETEEDKKVNKADIVKSARNALTTAREELQNTTGSMAVRKDRNTPVQKTEMGPSIAAIESRLEEMDEGIDKIINYFFDKAGDKGLFELVARQKKEFKIDDEKLETVLGVNEKDGKTPKQWLKDSIEALHNKPLSKSLDEMARVQSNAYNQQNYDDIRLLVNDAVTKR